MKLDVSTVLAGVDTAEIERLIAGTYMEKYGQHNAEIRKAIRLAKRLGLDTSILQDVLDLGSGVGWFLRVCSMLGHAASGIEQPGFMHQELSVILNVAIVEHRITAEDPLPDLGPDHFDLVTMVALNTHGKHELITNLNIALLRNVRPGGRFYRVVNHGEEWTLAPRYWPGWKTLNRGSRHFLLEKE
jgi:SAM-dependent methyltransferase